MGDDWGAIVDAQENALTKKVSGLKLDNKGASGADDAKDTVTKETVANDTVTKDTEGASGGGDGPAVKQPESTEVKSAETGASGEADDNKTTKEDESLLRKLIHSKLVATKADLEVLQKDPNSPLYSVKTFEALYLFHYLRHGCDSPLQSTHTSIPVFTFLIPVKRGQTKRDRMPIDITILKQIMQYLSKGCFGGYIDSRMISAYRELMDEIRRNVTQSLCTSSSTPLQPSTSSTCTISASLSDQDLMVVKRRNVTQSSSTRSSTPSPSPTRNLTQPLQPSTSSTPSASLSVDMDPPAECDASVSWSREAILYLIALYTENEQSLEDPVKKKKNVLHEKGYFFKQSIIESKSRNLQSKKDVSAHNQKTGRKRKTFQFFSEMGNILKKRHDIYSKGLGGNNCSHEKKLAYSVHKDGENVPSVKDTLSDDQSHDTNISKAVKDKYKKRGPMQSDTNQEMLSYPREKEDRRKQELEEREKRERK